MQLKPPKTLTYLLYGIQAGWHHQWFVRFRLHAFAVTETKNPLFAAVPLLQLLSHPQLDEILPVQLFSCIYIKIYYVQCPPQFRLSCILNLEGGGRDVV